MDRSTGRRRLPIISGVMLLALSGALVVTYLAIGSDVDADGMLHEPFVLVPRAGISGTAGAVLIAIGVWRSLRNHSREGRVRG